MRFPPFTYDKIKEKLAGFFNCEEIEAIARQSGFVQRKSALTGYSFLMLSIFDHYSLTCYNAMNAFNFLIRLKHVNSFIYA
jgi:hypothetical protein